MQHNYKGHNYGTGNRAVAENIKSMHANAGKSGDSISSMVKPTRSIAHAPGTASYSKQPHRSFSKQMD